MTIWREGSLLARPGQTEAWGRIVLVGWGIYLVQLIAPPPSAVNADTAVYEHAALTDYALVGIGPVGRVQVRRAAEDWLDW